MKHGSSSVCTGNCETCWDGEFVTKCSKERTKTEQFSKQFPKKSIFTCDLLQIKDGYGFQIWTVRMNIHSEQKNNCVLALIKQNGKVPSNKVVILKPVWKETIDYFYNLHSGSLRKKKKKNPHLVWHLQLTSPASMVCRSLQFLCLFQIHLKAWGRRNSHPSVNLLKAAGETRLDTDHYTAGMRCPADCPFNRQQQA